MTGKGQPVYSLGYGLHDRRNQVSIAGKSKIFFHFTLSTPDLGPTQTLTQCVSVITSLGVKQQGR